MLLTERRRTALLVLLAALPAVALAGLVASFWVNLPVSDEWGTSVGITLAKAREHTLSFLYLFSQHTESRPFFPRLVALALNVGGGEWDVRRGMVVNLLLAAGISALLWRVLDRARPAWSRFMVLFAMNLLLFSPVGWEIWLWGQGYLVLLTLICLAGTLAVNASGLSLAKKAGLNAALAFVGTFSFANGLLLWPLGWPRREGRKAEAGPSAAPTGAIEPEAHGASRGLAREGDSPGRGVRAAGVDAPTSGRTPADALTPLPGLSSLASNPRLAPWARVLSPLPGLRWSLPSAFYALAGLATYALFFIGFKAADRAALPFALGHPVAAGRYFLTWCAVPFRPGGEPDAGHAALGALVVALFLAGAIRAWRTDRRAAWPWLTLGAFALLSGVLAAVGRTRTGLEFALSSRYALTSALLPVAALGAWWTAGLRGWRPGWTTGVTVILAGGGLLFARAFGDSVGEMRGARTARLKARDALSFIDLIPENPYFRPIFPDRPEALRAAFHRFEAAGLVRVPGSNPALTDALAKPPGTAGGSGFLDACAPGGSAEQLIVRGWATDPTSAGERPAPFVIFQWTPLDAAGQPAGPPRPWTVLRVDHPRPDVANALKKPALATCGFEEATYRPLSALGAGPGRVSAWAVEPAAGKAAALTGTFDVPARR